MDTTTDRMENPVHEFETPEEVADRLRVPIRTLYDWRLRGVGPPALRIGKRLRYRRSDVDAWLAEQVA